ncbi:hypothetical protein L1049_020811 [Liquidambar formosana]|uniref:Uncharacterized protein n=1 Tax=Liquidambar formosana TaxID=63359 RepID=A0AAP0SDN0_LIQFO
MEDRDPTQEWKIQEYSSPSGGSSKVSWILNKGLCLGKKFVVTGIVISSAPLVLPPLVVLSALGLASSVPFGFYFASYACTDKLMSKLLSRPTPPLMLDYGTDDEETSGYEAEEDVGFGGGIDMEEEEEEQMEDIKEGVEMRVELLEKGNEGREQGNVPMEDNYGRGGLEMDQKPAKDVDEVLKEEGYEKDDEKLGEEIRKEQPLKKIIVEVSRGEQPLEEMGGVEVVVKGNEENGSKVEVEKPVGLKRGVVGERGGVEKASKIKKKEVKKPLKEQYYSVYKTPEENKQSSRSMAKGGVDFEGLPVSAGVVPESRSAVISTEKDITTPSDKNFAKGGKYGGELDLLEEEEIMKGTKNGVEIRIELLEKINEKLEAGNLLLAVDQGQGGFKKDEQKPVEYEKGRGYEEDNGVSSVKEEEHPWLETDVTIEGVREEENVSNIEEEKKIVMVESRDHHLAEEWAGNVVVVGAHEKNASNVEVEEPSGATSGVVQNRGREERVIYIEEGGKPGRETRGVMEESRYEGNVDNSCGRG